MNDSDTRLGIITNIASEFPSIHSGIALKYWLQSCARELVPNERVSQCLRSHAPLKENVEVHKAKEGKGAFYKGLVVCGSVWMCPVCASRISEERKRELLAGLSRWNGRLLMATYTLSHSRNMRLANILAAELDAYRSLKSGANFQRLKENFGWKGSVRTIEVTYGANGWHPHIHELVFIEMGKTKIMDSVYEGHLKAEIFRDWKRNLNKRGYGIDYTHGIDIRTAKDTVADYLAKWGREPINPEWTISSEITKQPTKKARQGGHTPTALLFDYGEGSPQCGRLWREYAAVLKGKHQLEWSRGMRDELGIGKEKTDGEIAAEIPAETYLLASLNKEQWKIILRADLRGEVLHHASEDDEATFSQWLGNTLEKWDFQLRQRRGNNPYLNENPYQ
jgi:hypothetical protein